MQMEFLAPEKKLVEAVVEWLIGKIREDAQVKSLAHLLVIVPTAQSGRNLRLNLAKTLARGTGVGAIIPPKVVTPFELVKSELPTGMREAEETEAAAAFQQFAKKNREKLLSLKHLVREEEFEDLTARFALFDQLREIWHTLASNGYLMDEVPEKARAFFEQDWGEEEARWQELAELEKLYFEYLHERGLVYPTEVIHKAKTSPVALPKGIEEIVLPQLSDPIKVLVDVLRVHRDRGTPIHVLCHAKESDAHRFDEWARPIASKWMRTNRPEIEDFVNEDIVCVSSASELAEAVAGDFPEVGYKMPALSICDETLFQGVAAKFLKKGIIVHNPEKHALLSSSLGGLIRALVAVFPAGEMRWTDFSTLFRSDDVLKALKLDNAKRREVLSGMDIVQNMYIPSFIPEAFAFKENRNIPKWKLPEVEAFLGAAREAEAKIAFFRENNALVGYLRAALKWIFDSHQVGSGNEDREFVAAARSVGALLEALESEKIVEMGLGAAEMKALFTREMENANYSLETESKDVLKTEGWLELAWSDAKRLALVGFHEGKVPDSIVGHAFLPDRMRQELELTTNEERLARDTWLFKELVDSHGEKHAIRAYISRANDSGDICRPSRLLYLCPDKQLALRIEYLFGEISEAHSVRPREVVWPLALPDKVEKSAHYSPSKLETYLNCPFNYLLKYGLKMESAEEKAELEANDFGLVVHAVLEEYAARQIAKGDDQATDEREIAKLLVEEILPPIAAVYHQPTLNVRLQLKAIEGRLKLFAKEQAEWARKGWRIRKAEAKIENFVPELGFKLKGTIDRVDENIDEAHKEERWCLIDYKTWDERSLTGHVYTSFKSLDSEDEQLKFAQKLGLSLVKKLDSKKKETYQRMLSVQLPMYGKGFGSLEPDKAFSDMQFRYCVLGKNAEESGYSTKLTKEQVDASILSARRAVELIEKNVFWPPAPGDKWKFDYGKLFVCSPQKDMAGSEWVKEQEQRLEAMSVRD